MSSGRLDHASEGTSATGAKSQVVHGSFTLRVDFSASPEQVFAAFAEPSLRTRWFRLPGSSKHATHALDFRVGGSEVATNLFVSGDVEERVEYRSRFHDIVPGERIVYAYEGHVDGLRHWVSLVTVELAAQAGGSRLDWTEQYTYLVVSDDGSQETAHLRGGTRLLLNGLSAVVDPHRFQHLARMRTDAS
ncbi:SRPBCC domain-containing protein [Kitasatospora mediocidica]|uniref:SRPBCC domain-containing protein n=1 Tax=Kitasatospora mediocidica TaxID=58352 RepID=UPI000A00E1F3|nr:SRPBCC domain-containing protein [Kitasatospora mediocidica]